MLEKAGYFQAQQKNPNINKTEQNNNQIYHQEMSKLFDSHNHILTRLLQEGLKIPEEDMKKIQKEKKHLKRFYFGLDNKIVDSRLFPEIPEGYLMFYTDTMPVVMPSTFLDDGFDANFIGQEPLVINLIKEYKWWDLDPNRVKKTKFLKPGLILFSVNNFIRKDSVRHYKRVDTPSIPQRSILFSISCNLFTLLLFFHKNRQYFYSLQHGINVYLEFINGLTKLKNV